MCDFFQGNVVNGTIGKQMVDTLVESASNVEVSNNFSLKGIWKNNKGNFIIIFSAYFEILRYVP